MKGDNVEVRKGAGGAVWVIIPARYESTRFPGKPLAEIHGKPMIQHVCERAGRATAVERVLVATDDERISTEVRNFGGEAVITGACATGTDRIAEALRHFAADGDGPEWVVNVQGDEPMIDPGDLDLLVRGMRDIPDSTMGTLVYPLRTEEELHDPNVVKAVLDQTGRGLYFSRAPLPYPRAPGGLGWRHMGIYLFRADYLRTFAALAPTPLSQREQLEQLRAIEHGHTIHCFEAGTLTIGVDVPEDIARAEALMQPS